MVILELLLTSVLHALPRVWLEKMLEARLSRFGFRYLPRFSGRIALWRLCEALKKNSHSDVALCPDYICNVVPKALKLAGWKVLYYRTGPELEADWDEIVHSIKRFDASLLVGASVCGSSGLIRDVLDADGLEMLEALDVHVVLDLCQDVRLIEELSRTTSKRVHAVLSFNNKSFPGAMGGGILSRSTFSLPEAPSLPRALNRMLYRSYLVAQAKRVLSMFKTRSCQTSSGFSFSQCRKFPYQFVENDYRLSRLQMILAVVGLSLLPLYNRNKQRVRRGEYVNTAYADSAAFLVTQPGVVLRGGGRKYKAPYARDEDPASSLRANDFFVHNKGFDDM